MSRYNHLYSIAFSVDTNRSVEDPIDDYEIIAAILARLKDVIYNGEIGEAIGLPLETIDNESNVI